LADEKAKLAEIDSLNDAAEKRIKSHITRVLDKYFNGVSMPDYMPEIDAGLVRDTERIIAASLLLGRLHASGSINAADGDIPPVAFEDAAQFIKAKIPVTKSEWNALEPKMRFRAFTVAALAECDYIETAKGLIMDAIKTGKGYAETWEQLKAALGDDAMKLRPGYWENVYRTNSQTAYNAGKVMEFEKTPPDAIQLFVVDDGRTSDICRGLLRAAGEGYILPRNHKFWSEYGYPPYHYQCRTSIAGVSKSQLADFPPDNPSMDILRKDFKPMEGFGGNPVAKESWWKLTDGMITRAAKYGIEGEIAKMAITLGMKSYALNLVKGYETVYVGKNGGYVKKAKTAVVGTKNKNVNGQWVETDELGMAKKAAENGHQVFFMPRTKKQGISSMDVIIDDSLGDVKHIFTPTKTAIDTAMKKAKKQGSTTVLIEIVTPDLDFKTVSDAVKNRLGNSIAKALVWWNGKMYQITKKP
jgi:hypothetical protein